jgi:hypothetical protein
LDDRDEVSIGCGRKRRGFPARADAVIGLSLSLCSFSASIDGSVEAAGADKSSGAGDLSKWHAFCNLLDLDDCSTNSGLNLRTSLAILDRGRSIDILYSDYRCSFIA